VGSAFLGFCFAALPLTVLEADPRGPLLAGFFVGPFVFDAGLAFVIRATRGENVFFPHRRHLYQRLVDAGLSHVSVASLYLVFAALLALGGAMIWWDPRYGAPAAVLAGSFACLLLAGFVRHVERSRRIDITRESLQSS
jgi:UDP-N-acetylmuramyl pentapeptide phosphotransferase/UDP-N-acetylglucosamine-1-phosphate transferase